jgi:predicted dehydrogenase
VSLPGIGTIVDAAGRRTDEDLYLTFMSFAAPASVLAVRMADGAMREVRIPESVVVTGRLAGGGHYVYTFSGVAAHAPGDRIEIYGTKGALHYDVLTHTVALGVDPSRRVQRPRHRARAPEPVEIGRPARRLAGGPLRLGDRQRRRPSVEMRCVHGVRRGVARSLPRTDDHLPIA